MDWDAIRLLYYRIYIKHRPNNTYVFLWCGNYNRIAQKRWRDRCLNCEESEIDRLVYQLYGLTEEEIKIIEQS